MLIASENAACIKQINILVALIYLAQEAPVLIDKDRSHVNKHGCSATPSGQGGYSQSFLDTISHHQGGLRIVCQRHLKQCEDAGKKNV